MTARDEHEIETYKRRNLEICEKHRSGASIRALATEYGLSRQWISLIVSTNGEGRGIPKNDLYYTIFNLPLSRTGATRLYGALRRCGINTAEELKDKTGPELIKKRNIGEKFVTVMADAGLLWE